MKSPKSNEENESVAKSRPSFYLGTVVVLLIMIAAVGIGFLAKSEIRNPKSETPVEPTATSTVEEKKEFTLEVWDGSGVAGAVVKEAERLEKLGIKIIGAGTAEEKVKGNELWVRKGYEEEAKKWLTILKVEEITGILAEGTAGARLVLGR